MSVLDVEGLLKEIAPDQPSGEDLEYDAAFLELERSAEGKPEQQFGDTIIPAEDPDWREVKTNALEVLGRSHDLRADLYLARAVIRTDGFLGLHDALQILCSHIERYWETVHPQIDPEDPDPDVRILPLTTLSDTGTVIRAIREAPLVNSRALGRFSMRDIDVATGEISLAAGSEEEAPQLSTIEGAFMDASLEDLQATADALDGAVGFTQQIEQMVTEHVGDPSAISLNPLVVVLRDARRVLAERLAQRGVGDAGAVEGGEDGAPGEGGVAVGAAGGTGARPMAGEITSREDVMRVIDKICTWYDRAEPSSPVPLLLKRAKRLVTMDFMDIMRDMAPDGVHQIEKIRGEEPASE